MNFNEVDLWPRSDPGNVRAGFQPATTSPYPTTTRTGRSSQPARPLPLRPAMSSVSLAEQDARYVRINGLSLTANSSGNYYMQLAEVQLFNRPSGPQNQDITFNPIPSQAVGGTLTVSATASSGLPVSFILVQNGNCSISGNVVTFLNAGNCGVIAAEAVTRLITPRRRSARLS